MAAKEQLIRRHPTQKLTLSHIGSEHLQYRSHLDAPTAKSVTRSTVNYITDTSN